jgi:transmembrane protein 231
MPQLYKDTYKKIYEHNLLSAANLCAIILVILTIAIPFFLGFYTNDFYKKVGTYFEMPDVEFTKEFAIGVVEDTAGVITDKFYTSVPTYADKNYNSLAPPYFSYYTEDQDDDGKVEKFVFDIKVRATTTNVRSVNLALAFQYNINDRLEEKMISLAFFQIDAPNGLGTVEAYGSLVLNQRDPINYSTKEVVEYNSNPLLKVLNASLVNMYSEYRNREEFTEFEGDIVAQTYGSPVWLKFKIELLIPAQQEIKYIPSFLESIKSAWVQYIFILIPFYVLLILYVLRFILSNQIIETHISNNLPTKKDRRWYRKLIPDGL